MALIKNKNFSGTGLARFKVSNGDMIKGCNFSQITPHTKIAEGYSSLTFQGCNLFNCSVPNDSVIEDCLTVQKSCCSHINPERGLPECSENCIHVIDTDEVWIDGVLIDKIYHYKDKRVN